MRPALLCLALGALLALGGCAFPFIPVIPTPLTPAPRLEVGPATTLERVGAEVVLRLELRQVPRAGYLSAFLYRDGVKVAEDSRLLEPASRSAEFRFSPAQVGSYRALVFWDGTTVRQLELDLK